MRVGQDYLTPANKRAQYRVFVVTVAQDVQAFAFYFALVRGLVSVGEGCAGAREHPKKVVRGKGFVVTGDGGSHGLAPFLSGKGWGLATPFH